MKSASIPTLVCAVIPLMLIVAILTTFILFGRREGGCWFKTFCFPVFMCRPSHHVASPLVLLLSCLFYSHFLIRFGLSVVSSCVPSASWCVGSVSVSSMVTSLLSLSMHMFSIWCAMLWVPASIHWPCRAPFPFIVVLLRILCYCIVHFLDSFFLRLHSVRR
jgi:hypothetical protein